MASIDAVPNDRRGWILCLVSAVACTFGASIICVDVFVRLLPGKKDFRIQDSNAFLSCSLSLSFGVMIFSALFSMLPSAKKYLVAGGQTEQLAGFLMMAAFVIGFFGIQVVSRIIHGLMPSHVVDCDHTHDEEPVEENGDAPHPHAHLHHSHSHGHSHGHGHSHPPRPSSRHLPSRQRSLAQLYSSTGAGVGIGAGAAAGPDATESTPLLPSMRVDGMSAASSVTGDDLLSLSRPDGQTLPRVRRPSMKEVRHRLLSFVKDTKANCDEFGPCFGYSDPCGQECVRHLSTRTPSLLRDLPPPPLRHTATTTSLVTPSGTRPTTPAPLSASGNETSVHHAPWNMSSESVFSVVPEAIAERSSEEETCRPTSDSACHPPAVDGDGPDGPDGPDGSDGYDPTIHADGHSYSHAQDVEAAGTSTVYGQASPHHHHVPTNAFMSIGLQTVLAIGLHKFPEGFITFATNHANPELGFSVFLALLVHNIAEGFAMALPLYMALGSRLRAILWASALGGLSQPLGAGMAALWLWYIGRGQGQEDDGSNGDGSHDNDENGVAYGLLFAVTAGIMVAVALQLFVEGLTLHHNRQLNILFAFIGMLLLGLSSSLVQH